jgi:hypothetical protein
MSNLDTISATNKANIKTIVSLLPLASHEILSALYINVMYQIRMGNAKNITKRNDVELNKTKGFTKTSFKSGDSVISESSARIKNGALAKVIVPKMSIKRKPFEIKSPATYMTKVIETILIADMSSELDIVTSPTK